MRRQCPQLDQGLATLLAGSERPRPAGEHAGLVLRRVRPNARRSTGSRPGTAAATITAMSSPCWSPAADSRAATSSARPMRRPKRSRSGPSIRWTCWAASISWPASTPRAKLPHPMGLEAHVLPAASEGVKSAGLLDGDHVACRRSGHGPCSKNTLACDSGGWPCACWRWRLRRRRSRDRTSVLSIPPAASRARPSRSGWAGRAWTTSTRRLVSGTGVSAKVVEYHRRLNNQEIQLLREQLNELKKAASRARRSGRQGRRPATTMMEDSMMARRRRRANRRADNDEATQKLIAKIESGWPNRSIRRPPLRSPTWSSSRSRSRRRQARPAGDDGWPRRAACRTRWCSTSANCPKSAASR